MNETDTASPDGLQLLRAWNAQGRQPWIGQKPDFALFDVEARYVVFEDAPGRSDPENHN